MEEIEEFIKFETIEELNNKFNIIKDDLNQIINRFQVYLCKKHEFKDTEEFLVLLSKLQKIKSIINDQ